MLGDRLEKTRISNSSTIPNKCCGQPTRTCSQPVYTEKGRGVYCLYHYKKLEKEKDNRKKELKKIKAKIELRKGITKRQQWRSACAAVTQLTEEKRLKLLEYALEQADEDIKYMLTRHHKKARVEEEEYSMNEE